MNYFKTTLAAATLIAIFSGCDSIEPKKSTNNQEQNYKNSSLRDAIKNNKVAGYKEDGNLHDNYLAVVNYYRTSNMKCNDSEGNSAPVAKLKWNELLYIAAKEHSDDMRDNTYMSHNGSDGTSHIDRIKDSGYSGTYLRENVAFKGSSSPIKNDAWLDAMEDLINGTDGHCSNILNSNLTDFAMAESKTTQKVNGYYRAYWTQTFGKE